MKQPEIYEIEDGLHELGMMGKTRVTSGQMFCKDFFVILREWWVRRVKDYIGGVLFWKTFTLQDIV